MLNINDNEKKVLATAGLNAGAGLVEIAAKAGLKIHTARYSLQRLLEKEVIVCRPIINFSRIGFSEIHLYLSLSSEASARKDCLDYLSSVANVLFVTNLNSQYPVKVCFLAKDENDVANFIDSCVSCFGAVIRQRIISRVVSQTFYGRRYHESLPLATKSISVPTLQRTIFTEREHVILSALAKNPGLSIRALARKLSLTQPTLTHALKRLSEKGIIAGLVYTLPTSFPLDIQRHMFQIRFGCSGKQMGQRLFSFAAGEPEVVWLVRVTGFCDYELIVETANNMDLLSLEDRLRRTLADSQGEVQCIAEISRKAKNSYPLEEWPNFDDNFCDSNLSILKEPAT